MNVINHVKIVTPDPEAVEVFLREVAGIPDGFPIPGYRSEDPLRGTQPREREAPTGGETLTWDDVARLRGSFGDGGFIAGTTKSRQLQVLRGEAPGIWAVAIGTRDLEGVAERCRERGIPMTETELVDFVGSKVRAFFVRVGGLTFEFMRVE